MTYRSDFQPRSKLQTPKNVLKGTKI